MNRGYDAKCRRERDQLSCPKCGQDLQQTIGLLKSYQRLVCNSCGVGISFDTAKLAEATEILQEVLDAVSNEITIRFFR